MKTLISSIPLITIPNKREYSIEDIKEKLSDHYSISKRDDKTLEVSSSECGTFYLTLSGGLRFLKLHLLRLRYYLYSRYYCL